MKSRHPVGMDDDDDDGSFIVAPSSEKDPRIIGGDKAATRAKSPAKGARWQPIGMLHVRRLQRILKTLS